MDQRRRQVLRGLIGTLAAGGSGRALAALAGAAAGAEHEGQAGHQRVIPGSGESLPVLGLGSWLTFDAPPGDGEWRARCFDVMQAFFAAGGQMIDSSPMYGYSQDVIGAGWRAGGRPGALFSATKVWIPGGALGAGQIERAHELWGLERFDLVQVHNLLDWRAHLDWLYRWRAEGRVRYVGVTTSHGRRHEELEAVLRREPIDFVQFTLNIVDREAERRLLPLAREHGKAVIINRPFRGGDLFRQVRGHPLPRIGTELGCSSWAQFLLHYVVSHPGVTCAIPATSRVDHLRENMAVLSQVLPDAGQRNEMVRQFEALA